MKRTVIVSGVSSLVAIILTSLVWAAGINANPEQTPELQTTETWNIDFEIIQSEDSSYWKNNQAYFDCDMIRDEKAAVEIATAVLHNLDRSLFEGYFKPESVTFNVSEDAWIVYFRAILKENPDAILLDGGYYVVLRKSDGCVLKICGELFMEE